MFFQRLACHKNCFNYFRPWTADVQGPLLNSPVMNAVMTACAPRPVKNHPVRAPGLQHESLPPCRPGPLTRRRSIHREFPERAGLTSFSGLLRVSVPPWLIYFASSRLAPSGQDRLCVKTGLPFWCRASRLDPAQPVLIRPIPPNKKNKKYEIPRRSQNRTPVQAANKRGRSSPAGCHTIPVRVSFCPSPRAQRRQRLRD